MSRKQNWIRNTALVTTFAMLGLVTANAHAKGGLSPRNSLPKVDFYSSTALSSSSDTGTITDTATETSTLAAVPAAAPAPMPAPRPAVYAPAAVGAVAAAAVAYILQRLFNMPSVSEGALWKQLAKELKQRDIFVDLAR